MEKNKIIKWANRVKLDWCILCQHSTNYNRYGYDCGIDASSEDFKLYNNSNHKLNKSISSGKAGALAVKSCGKFELNNGKKQKNNQVV